MAQTVHATFNGVDPFSGSSTTGESAGTIRGNKAVRIKAGLGKINDALPGSTYLIPVYDENGDIAAYERTMDPKQREALQQEKHLARTLGIWSGRIVEETESDFANTQLVNTLKKIYDDEFSKNGARGFPSRSTPKEGRKRELDEIQLVRPEARLFREDES